LLGRPEFTELQVWINNPSENNYDDISPVIRPNDPIAAIAQATNVPDVSFEDKNGVSLRLTDINPTAGTKTAIPVVLLATDAGYRVRCPRLPAKTTIRVEIALADIKWNPSPPNDRPIEEKVRDINYIFRLKQDDFSTYWLVSCPGDFVSGAPPPTARLTLDLADWLGLSRVDYCFHYHRDSSLGHAEANDYTPRPTSTDWARIEGEYKAAQRKRSISQKIQIAGNLTVKHQ
jgi:hypothetical protein